MNVNKVFIYGNLTRDPEVKQLPSGTKVAQLGIATNRIYNNQQGEKVTEVEYHNVTMFGRLSELAEQYLKKGGGLFVEGRLRTSSWDGEDGVKRYKTEIIAENMQFGPRTGGSDANPDTGKGEGAPEGGAQDKGSSTINPDDIPF